MFKTKIKIKYHSPFCCITQYGNWIDLKSTKTYNIKEEHFSSNSDKFKPLLAEEQPEETSLFVYKLIPLGVSMQLPKYYEAHIVPRSSTFMRYKIIQANSMGIIDSTYCGDNDQWFFPALFLAPSVVHEGTRICQFTIRLSLDAPWYIKLKHLFTKLHFETVATLHSPNRGGFGSTGYK